MTMKADVAVVDHTVGVAVLLKPSTQLQIKGKYQGCQGILILVSGYTDFFLQILGQL